MTNLVTHEILKARGVWLLRFADDGFDGCISKARDYDEDAEPDIQEFHELFCNKLVEHPEGGLHVLSTVLRAFSLHHLSEMELWYCLLVSQVYAIRFQIMSLLALVHAN